ncbi:MAG: hypothetical protein LBC85_01895 [Fibromonadaceae bacterium]|nr:hypothetical protein [Fibromonadaceae bacterium]
MTQSCSRPAIIFACGNFLQPKVAPLAKASGGLLRSLRKHSRLTPASNER